jgi:hypothetical protein
MRYKRLTVRDWAGGLLWLVVILTPPIGFAYLGLLLGRRTLDEDARQLRPLFMLLAGLIAMVTPFAFTVARSVPRRYFRALQSVDDELRERCRRAASFRELDGEVQSLCKPSELLFSPFTHRACVAWSVVTTRGGMPWHADGASATSVTEGIPFGLRTVEGDVRIERVETILVPRVEGLARRLAYTLEQQRLAEAFYGGRGGPGEAYATLRNADSLSTPGPTTTYELIIPPQGHVRLFAAVYDDDPAGAANASKNAICIEVARALVGTNGEVAGAISAARAAAYRAANLAAAFGLVTTIVALVYAYLAYFGYLD